VTVDNPSTTTGNKLVEIILDEPNLIKEKTEYNNKADTIITIY